MKWNKEEWEEQNLGNLFTISSGGTPSRKNTNYFGGDIPWIKTGDLKGKYVIMPSEKITELGLANSSAKLFPKLTVLLAMYGATIGACSILKFAGATNQACAALLPSQKCNETFIYYFFRGNKAKIIKMGVGGAQPNISARLIKKIKIPLPPLEIQKEIAHLLDTADALRQKTKDQLKELDKLAQSVFLEMFGDPVTNEKGWEVRTIDQVCNKILGGGTPSKSKPEYYIGNIPWVTPKDMKLDYISDSIDHVNENAINNSSAKLIPSNSLLMVIRSGILKRKLPLAINTKPVVINQDMKAYVVNPNISSIIYLHHFFFNVQSYLLSKVRAVTADNIEFRQIKELKIPLPSLPLQNHFAAIIENIEAQKTRLKASLKESEDLFNCLLQDIFG